MRSSNLRVNPNRTPPPDIEPVLVRQTAEPEHLAAKREWFVEAAADAVVNDGCTFFRYSVHEEPEALLIEGWTGRPADQGNQRWSFTAHE